MGISDEAVTIIIAVLWGTTLLFALLATISCWCFLCCPSRLRNVLFVLTTVLLLTSIFTTAALLHRLQELWSDTKAVVTNSIRVARILRKL